MTFKEYFLKESNDLIGEKGKFYTITNDQMWDKNQEKDLSKLLKDDKISGYKKESARTFLIYSNNKSYLIDFWSTYGYDEKDALKNIN